MQKKVKLKCSSCSSDNIRLFRIQFKDLTWHVKGHCECGRSRFLDRYIFYSDDLPIGVTKKQMKLDRQMNLLNQSIVELL